MQRADVLQTIQQLKKTGVGIDAIGHRIVVFHELPCKIIGKANGEGANLSGYYYVEGDVTDFMNGYDKFWVNRRSSEEVNLFEVISSTYDSEKLQTEIAITYSSEYSSKASDIDGNICGRYDLSAAELVKNIGEYVSEMEEDGSLGNISADKFSFTINDEARNFYDKRTRTGFWFAKDVNTEVTSIQSRSEHSPVSGVFTTFVAIKDFEDYAPSDFKYGVMEVITGEAAGNKYVIVGASGNSVKVLGHLSKDYLNVHEYHADLRIGDKVRVTKTPVFHALLQVWHRDEYAERFNMFFGKIDMSDVTTDDLQRSVGVTAYNSTRDMMDLDLTDLRFENGMGLPRMRELTGVHMTGKTSRLRKITREVHPDSPLQSITIQDVGYDVDVGWHSLDYYPGGLFRFDMGKWFQVTDEGSFEKSTNSIFIASNQDATHYYHPAVLPNHSIDPANNQAIERLWHGGWCRFTVATEEALFIGTVNNTGLNDGNTGYKKLSGLPNAPHRLMFYVDSDRKITKSSIFTYSYDFGEYTLPHYHFDYIKELDLVSPGEGSRDVTYPLAYGSKVDVDYINSDTMADFPYPMRYELGVAEHVLQLGSFRKFNGVYLKFRNEHSEVAGDVRYASGYDSLLTSYMQNLLMRFSDGNGSFRENIPVIYTGAVATLVGTDSSAKVTLKRSISRAGDINGEYGEYQEAMVGMKLVAVNGDNFLEDREILTVADGGSAGRIVDITFDPFDNAVAQYDRFVVVNKNFNMKFVDFGSSFKEGPECDVLALNRVTKDGVPYFLDFQWRYATSANIVSRQLLSSDDRVYIGHRSRFNAVSLMATNIVGESSDAQDVAWYIKNAKFGVEYWDGANWIVANNVTVIPTTMNPTSDRLGNADDDDRMKYTISFSAGDWATGGYDEAEWSTLLESSIYNRGAPSNTPSDSIYMIRLSILSKHNLLLTTANISNLDDLNLVVTWKDIQGWAKNSESIEDGKTVVVTLTDEDAVLEMYQIEVQCRQSYTWMRQARPVTQLVSSTGEELYVMIDGKEIDDNMSEDIIDLSNQRGSVGVIPRDISMPHMIERIVDKVGFRGNKESSIHLDAFSNPEHNYLNIIGNNYDKVYPAAVGWDRALYSNAVDGFFDRDGDTTEYRKICCIRDNGKYRMFCVHKDRLDIDMWTSDDLKSWTKYGSVISSIGSWEILSLEVVKNRNDSKYIFYITARNGGNYGIYVLVAAQPTVINLAATTEIISDVSYNFGECSAMQLRGLADESGAGVYHWLCVAKYDGTAITSGVPSDTPYLAFWKCQEDVLSQPDWSQQAIMDYHDGNNPVYVESSFVLNDGSLAENEDLNKQTLVYVSNGELYKLKVNMTAESGNIDASYFASNPQDYPEKIYGTDGFASISIVGFTAVKDAYVYEREDDRPAHTLVPTHNSSLYMIGTDDTGDTWDMFVMNGSFDSWDTDMFWTECTDLFNVVDWFKLDQSRIELTNSYGQEKDGRLMLGFRRPFTKIQPMFVSVPYSNRLKLEYWNGIQWSAMPRIYQNGRTITDGLFNPIFAFYFDKPTDWVVADLKTVQSADAVIYPGLDQKGDSLFWVRMMVNPADESYSVITTKGMKLCYTSLFLTKGRSLYLMEEWKYVKQLYAYPYEMDKNVVIDSFAYDPQSKLLVVNYVEENPYELRKIETLVFDAFGNMKSSYPQWIGDNPDPYGFYSERPAVLTRDGYNNEVTIGGADTPVMSIGVWDEAFVEDVFGASAFTGQEGSGYNIPIPREQYLRKYSPRNIDWQDNGTYFLSEFINNIWVAKRVGLLGTPAHTPSGRYQTANAYQFLLASLTQSGLLHEELINSPTVKIPVGFYAFMEKSYKTRYEELVTDIQDIVTDYPGAPSEGQVWLVQSPVGAGLLDDNNSLLHYVNSAWQLSRPYVGMLIQDLSDSNALYVWEGYKWEVVADTVIWEGRDPTADTGKIWLEFNCGQQGVDLSYFRGYNSRTERFISNNTQDTFDGSSSIAFRDVMVGKTVGIPFGTKENDVMESNLRATCSVILPDASAVKDSPTNKGTKENDGYSSEFPRLIDPAMPAVAFGCYAFRDTLSSGSVTRDDATKVNPYAFSGIALHKPFSRIRDWAKVLYQDGPDYWDRTDDVNYKRYGNSFGIRGNPDNKYLLLGSTSRFFSIGLKAAGVFDSLLTMEYMDKSGSWQPIDFVTDNSWSHKGESFEDLWSYKTVCASLSFDPFKDDWQKYTIEGDELYWVRIGTDNSTWYTLNWAVLSGTMLWDNMVWWDDYTTLSDKAPTSPSDADKRFFDTYIPMSIEYDEINRKLIGCFWNFDPNHNEYYPFKITFDPEEILDVDYYYWNWENNNTIRFVDKAGPSYTRKIQSLATISHIDTKAILVEDSKPDEAAKMATIKSLNSGDKLFGFDIQ